MATKHVYEKSIGSAGDFVYIDLLPEVKRSRQFNMNVIAALFLGVILSFILIYMPYSKATATHESLNALNNDLVHELMLTNEEFIGYEINLDTIVFEEDIDLLKTFKVDFNNYLDDIELLTTVNGGTIIYTFYNAETAEFQVTVIISSPFTYNILNNDLLELDWVATSIYTTPSRTGDAVLYTATFTLGVEQDAE